MKKLLREKHKNKRRELSREVREKEEEGIFNALFTSDFFIGAKKVFVYNSFNGEVSTVRIIEELIKRGYEVFLPKIVGSEMKAARYAEEQIEDKFGIKEPVNSEYADSVDVAIVPLLCADKNLYRIGYGGGYYDRFFMTHTVKKIGICFSCQLEEKIDIEDHDIPLDVLIAGGKILTRR